MVDYKSTTAVDFYLEEKKVQVKKTFIWKKK
jgi:hypothetical protein